MKLHRRFSQHAANSNKYPLGKAIRKYGKESFEVTVLARANNQEELANREQYYIKLFNTLAPYGYNLTTGGDLFRHTEETKKKIGAASKGNKYALGKRYKKSPFTKEHKRNISLAKKGVPIKNNCKLVKCIETGVIYRSTSEAARQLNLQQSKICCVALGQRKMHGGFHFEYVKVV